MASGSPFPRTARPSWSASTSPIGPPRRSPASTSSRWIRRLPPPPTDETLAEQLTGMAWSIAKLTTLHRTIRPELLEQPNHLVTAEAAELGAADTTPDNLYMIGTFRLEPDQALVIDLVPPDTRYWSVTVENIWHECIDPRRRRSSITNAGAVGDGKGGGTDHRRRRRSRGRQLARHRRPSSGVRHRPMARQPRSPAGHHPGTAHRRGMSLMGAERFDRDRLVMRPSPPPARTTSVAPPGRRASTSSSTR